MSRDIWILLQHDSKSIDESSLSVISEAIKIKKSLPAVGEITGVLIGFDNRDELQKLDGYGAEKVICLNHKNFVPFNAELIAEAVSNLVTKYRPWGILTLDSARNQDLIPRLSARLQIPASLQTMELKLTDKGEPLVTRAVNCGFLFEESKLKSSASWIVSFAPAIFGDPVPFDKRTIEIISETAEIDPAKAGIILVEEIEADPEQLELEEADIIVSGGRGVGKKEDFQLVYDLAAMIGGSVGGTRPMIDNAILPYERQIGQTGKYVSPRLIINCGISGANEYTAGIEKAQLNIAINSDSRARIFRFADLGIVGDVHEVVRELIKRLKERQTNS